VHIDLAEDYVTLTEEILELTQQLSRLLKVVETNGGSTAP